MKKTLFYSMPFALLLAACGPTPSDQVAHGDASAPAAGAPRVVVPATTLIHAQPASLGDCNPTAVTLAWNTLKEHPGVSTVKIYTESGKLFAHVGAAGTLETGPWVKPGSTFVITNGEDGAELERLVIGGPICN